MEGFPWDDRRKFYLDVGWGALSQTPIRALPLDHTGGLPTGHCSRSSPSCIKWQSSPFGSVYGCGLVTMSAARQTPVGSRTRGRFLVLQEFGGTNGTDSWLRDTHGNFGPALPVLFKMHEKFDQLILRKINCYHQMSNFKAKMHQIRFRLGLRPRPRWGELTALPSSPSWIKGPTSKGAKGKKGREWGWGRKGVGYGERGEGNGREEEGKGRGRKGEMVTEGKKERGDEGKGRKREGRGKGARERGEGTPRIFTWIDAYGSL